MRCDAFWVDAVPTTRARKRQRERESRRTKTHALHTKTHTRHGARMRMHTKITRIQINGIRARACVLAFVMHAPHACVCLLERWLVAALLSVIRAAGRVSAGSAGFVVRVLCCAVSSGTGCQCQSIYERDQKPKRSATTKYVREC